MKQPIVYIALIGLALLTACSLISNNEEDAIASSTETMPTYQVSIESEIEDYKDYQFTIHYPKTPNSQIDQTIIDYVNQKKSTFKQKSYKVLHTKNSNQVHELHIDFETLYQDERFFVVRFVETMDFGLEETVVNQTIMNFDKEKGKRLNLKHIFKEDVEYIDLLAEITTNRIVESSDSLTKSNRLQVKSTLKARLDLHQPAAITAKGMTIYLNRQEIPFPVPLEQITIDYSELEELLKFKYSYLLNVDDKAESNPEGDEASSTNVKDTKRGKTALEGKKVALTFIDGPHAEVTPAILDILEEQDVKATFFMIGKRVRYFPEVTRSVSEGGHEIGNHTWDHSRLSRLKPEEIDQQFRSTQNMISQVTGQKPMVASLPFGESSTSLDQGVELVRSTINSGDWENLSSMQMAQKIIAEVKDGSIIALDELSPSTVRTVEILTETLKKQGYDFMTVSELQSG